MCWDPPCRGPWFQPIGRCSARAHGKSKRVVYRAPGPAGEPPVQPGGASANHSRKGPVFMTGARGESPSQFDEGAIFNPLGR